MTIQQIADKTRFSVEYLTHIYNRYGRMTYDQFIRENIGSNDEYDAYMYIWRNMAFRFSTIGIEYELTEEGQSD